MKTLNYKGYTIKIQQDTDPLNPREEWDNLGTMFCQHTRYTLGDKKAENPFIENEETGKWELRKNIAVILPLYLYEHGGITISIGSFSDSWDSGQVGVIYITKEKLKEEKMTKEQAKKCLRAEVETYDDYLTGNVYGFIVESPDGREIDSCWGYYGDPEKSGAIDEAKSIVDYDIQKEAEAEKTVKESFAL